MNRAEHKPEVAVFQSTVHPEFDQSVCDLLSFCDVKYRFIEFGLDGKLAPRTRRRPVFLLLDVLFKVLYCNRHRFRVVILPTAERARHNWVYSLLLSRRLRIVVGVHNLDFWMSSRQKAFFRRSFLPGERQATFKRTTTCNQLGTLLLAKRTSAFLTISGRMANTVAATFRKPAFPVSSRPAPILDTLPSFFDSCKPKSNNGIVVGIPGAVTSSRRDYELLFRVLSMARPAVLSVRLIGRVQEPDIPLRGEIEFNLPIEAWQAERRLTAEEFSEHLDASDVLVTASPLGSGYGQVTETGAIGDAIAAAKPLFNFRREEENVDRSGILVELLTCRRRLGLGTLETAIGDLRTWDAARLSQFLGWATRLTMADAARDRQAAIRFCWHLK